MATTTGKTVNYMGISLFTTKTFWLNFVAFVVAILSLTEVVTLIPARYMALYGAVVAILNTGLRLLTVRPAFIMAPGETRSVEVQKIGPPKPPTINN
jgi:hypothetical protein